MVKQLDLEESVKIPYLIESKILMSPGIWNNYYYSEEQIKSAFTNTDWDNKEIRSLFLDHEDLRSSEWIGEVVNVRLDGNNLIGDLVIVDKPTAMKLAYGAKMGISPKVHGKEEGGRMLNFLFDNMSVVINPAVKTAYINNQEQTSEVNKMTEEKIENAQVPEVPEEKKDTYPAPEMEEKVEKKEVKEEVQMAEADMIDQILKLVTALKEKKGMACAEMPKKMPVEKKEEPMAEKIKEEVKEEVKKEMSKELEAKETVIQTMSQKIAELEKKFNEPAKEIIVENAASQNVSLNGGSNSIDMGYLNFLKSMRNY